MPYNFAQQLQAQLVKHDEEKAKLHDQAKHEIDLIKQQKQKHREFLRKIVRPVFEETKTVLSDRCKVHIIEDKTADENPDTIEASIEMTLHPKTGRKGDIPALPPQLSFSILKNSHCVQIVTQYAPLLTDEPVEIKLSKLNSKQVASVVLRFTASIFKV